MEQSKRYLAVLGTLAVLLAWVPVSFSQTLYSFVDANGVRNFTNIPPVNPVGDYTIANPTPVPKAPVAGRPLSSRYDPIIEKYAAEYRLDPSLIRSMIAKESGFNHRAVSRKGARGLMQLMPETAVRNGVRDIFDPEDNIRGGMRHLRSLLDMFNNNLVLSLAAYNAGENLVQRIGRVPNFRETHDYVRTITARYGKKQMEPQPEAQQAELSQPSVYRFQDSSGVMHLTNVPPIRRAEDISLAAAGQTP